MKILKKIIISSLSASIGLFSCDSFLSESPLSEISSENFYKTGADAKAGVSALYANLGGYYGGNVWYIGDVSTETANRGELTGGLDVLEFVPTDPTFRDTWTVMYRGINYANNALKAIPPIGMDETLKNQYLGEVKFLRALYYFNLVRSFGDVPLITEPTVDETNNRLPRTSKDEVYKLIEKDLLEAAATLPKTYAASETGRATKGAAQALLARVYLTTGNWQKAKETAQEVINSGTYRLLADFKHVFDVSRENGAEHIFSVQFKSGNVQGVTSSLSSTFASRNPNILLNGAISGSGVAAERGYYHSVPDHYRKMITMVDSFPSKYYPEITARGKAQAGPAIMKYWDPNFGKSTGGDANWIVLRYAEVLLTFAEAENELNGPTTAAYEAINAIRKRARDANANGVSEPEELSLLPDLSGLSKTDFKAAVLNERRMELAFEGERRWDLVRTGTYIQVLKNSGKDAEEKHLLLPIPFLEIQANPSLTQNPGYPQ
jgi:tetratricopeptide (TPR) repeat protein